MKYTIRFQRSAAKALAALPKPIQRRIAGKVDDLARDPHPPGAKALEGVPGLHRIRIGDYRVIYQIQAAVLLILVVRIRHRREAYRGL